METMYVEIKPHVATPLAVTLVLVTRATSKEHGLQATSHVLTVTSARTGHMFAVLIQYVSIPWALTNVIV